MLKMVITLFFFALPAFAIVPAKALLQENRIDEALEVCRQFEAMGSEDRENGFACAWVYFRSDKNDAGEKWLEKLKSNYTTPEYQLLLGFSRMKKKQYEEAKKIYDSIVQEFKGTSSALTAQELTGEYYEAKGQLNTAAFLYNQVVRDDPKRARSHWGLGRHYLASGDTRRAIEHFETTTRLWPKHVGSRFNLAVIALSQDNIPQAAKWLTECYRLDKADAGVLEQLGVLFEKKGMMAEAIRNWQRAIEIKKDSPIAREKLSKNSIYMIDNLIEQKRYSEALSEIEAKKGNIEDQPKLLLKRGLVYRALGKYEKAASDLKGYISHAPQDATANKELGICYLNMKLIDSAEGYFKKAIQIEPDNGIHHAWLAFVYEGKKEWDSARGEWRKAVEMLSDPVELEKANRKLSSLEKRMTKSQKEKKKKRKAAEEDEEE